MAMMKVHGTVYSTAAMRVCVCLYEKDLEFEFVPVSLRSGEHKKDHFLALNPFGQVPAFEEGDLKLFQSRAITQYIAHGACEKGTQLIVSGPKNMAILSVWMEVEAHQCDPAIAKINWEHVFKPMYGMVTDLSIVEEQEAKLAKVFDVYESRLSQSKYLASDCFTLADMHHMPDLHFLMNTPSKKLVECRPHVSKWVADILARPAWAKVVAMDKQ